MQIVFNEGLCAWHIIFASFYVCHSLIELTVTNNLVLRGMPAPLGAGFTGSLHVSVAA